MESCGKKRQKLDLICLDLKNYFRQSKSENLKNMFYNNALN